MSPRAAGSLAALVTAALVSNCGFITGVGDLQPGSCVADCGTPADVVAGDASMDAGADARLDALADGTGRDVAPDTLGCATIDCANPGCMAMGYACVPDPVGWSLVALSAAGRTACPAGYGSAHDLTVDPDLGSYSCPCSCSVTDPPSCTTGTLDLHQSSITGGCATAVVGASGNGGACSTHTFGSIEHQLQPLPPTGGSCTATLMAEPPAAGTNGRTCTASPPVGGGCAAGSVCVLRPGAPYEGCVEQSGGAMCPAGYSKMHSAGDSLTDTRACGACPACGPPTATCASPEMTFFTTVTCGTLVGTLPADGLCHPTAWTAAAYEYTATVTNPQCPAGAAAQPSGSATLNNLETICCP